MDSAVWISLAVGIPGTILALSVMAERSFHLLAKLRNREQPIPAQPQPEPPAPPPPDSPDNDRPSRWTGRPASIGQGLIGRSAQLDEIAAALSRSRITVLSGQAGTGKSRLAAELTQRTSAHGFWTQASDDGAGTLAALAEPFGLETDSLKPEEIPGAVSARLRNMTPDIVWVVDNLPDLDQLGALRNASQPVRLLITTRDRGNNLLLRDEAFIPVGMLDPEDAVDLLRSRSDADPHDSDLEQIAETVGRLPYALEMLAIRLGDVNQTPQKVLAELGEQQNPLLLKRFQDAAGSSIDRPDGVLAAITGTLEVLTDEQRNQLAPFGYLADAPIPAPLAQALAGTDEPGLDDLLTACGRQSIARIEEEQVIIHALTTAAIAATNPDAALGTARRWRWRWPPLSAATNPDAPLETALLRAHGRLRSINLAEHTHLRSELAHYERLNEVGRHSRETDQLSLANFSNGLGIAYRTLGRTADAIPLFEETLAARERLLDRDHPDTLTSRSNLAIAYADSGRLDDAIRLGEETLAASERVLGSDHPDTLGSRNNLAAAYGAAGRTAEAISLHEQTLAAHERLLGPDHPDTLSSRNNLANAYGAAGRTAEAVRLHEQTLASRERLLGPDHPDTLSSRNNLAGDYREAGRLDEAIPILEQTLKARERLLDPDHPDILASRGNLAAAYAEAGRTAEAISLHEQTLAARERLLGPDHPKTLGSRHNLAHAYADAARLDDAIRLGEETLAARERVLGPDHPDTVSTRHNLAIDYHTADRDADAARLEQQGPASP